MFVLMLMNIETPSCYYSRQHGKRTINVGKLWLQEALKCVRNIRKNLNFYLGLQK